jgi:hypothetical protein
MHEKYLEYVFIQGHYILISKNGSDVFHLLLPEVSKQQRSKVVRKDLVTSCV